MNYIEAKIIEINSLINNPNKENVEKIKSILLTKERNLYGKHIIPAYASYVLLFLGKNGINILGELFKKTEGVIYPTTILETLYIAVKKVELDLLFHQFVDNKHILHPKVSNGMANLAYLTINELVIESLDDSTLFDRIINFVHKQQLENRLIRPDNTKHFSNFIFNVFRDSTIIINNRILENFRALIDDYRKEEDYQIYLKNNPSLLDPLAKEIIPKQKLGNEFVTDFVVRKLDDKYILVEIEKPTTPIFTRTNDFTSQFTHAMGQVIDFQEWVESNMAYADKLMPGISSPSGLLILGLSSGLNDFQRKKLKRFNINNSGRIEVITFDDLLAQGYKLYQNMVN